MLCRCEYITLNYHYIITIGITRLLPSSKWSVVYLIILKSPETRLVPISIRKISMHKIESREIFKPAIPFQNNTGLLWTASQLSQINRIVILNKSNDVEQCVKMIKVGNSHDVGGQTLNFELFPLYLNCCLSNKHKT